MTNEAKLQQVIYDLLEMQIQFGVHRYGDSLLTIKEASTYFLASVDTVRLAYLHLKRNGYISLSTCVGATVKVRYSDEEIRQHIARYFSCRRESMLAFAKSVGLLANYTQWFALKRASPQTLDELERSCLRKEIPPVYRMSRQLQLLYSPLGNDLLLRLFWQMFMFFQAPFVSVEENLKALNGGRSPLVGMIRSVREKDWSALWDAEERTVEQYFVGLRRFFDESIPQNSGCQQIDFSWNIYKKSSQLCYSLCKDALMGIHEGRYPVGSFLPSPKKLAQNRKVSLNTIRRTIALLNKLGATQSVNGVGTKVIWSLDGAQDCDFTDPGVRNQVWAFLQCFHILCFSCRACAKITIDSMEAGSISRWHRQLEKVRQSDVYESLFYVCYAAISRHAPYPLLRTVYAELTRQIFGGFPLRNMHGDREHTKAHFRPYLVSLIECLSRADAAGFSANLEELQIGETLCIAQYLSGLGMKEAEMIVLPSRKNG